jgi:predicted metal-dependent hydrolase
VQDRGAQPSEAKRARLDVGQEERAHPAPPVEVRRSPRRRRTVSAYRDGSKTVVLIPASMSRADERRWVDVMLRRLDAQDRRRTPSDAELIARATRLSGAYLGGAATPASVRWVANQNSRWGSCTPSDRSIRISERVRGMPSWVVDYVIVHELAHLVHADHSPAFWDLVARYPRAERARGFLEGAAHAAGLRIGDDLDPAE